MGGVSVRGPATIHDFGGVAVLRGHDTGQVELCPVLMPQTGRAVTCPVTGPVQAHDSEAGLKRGPGISETAGVSEPGAGRQVAGQTAMSWTRDLRDRKEWRLSSPHCRRYPACYPPWRSSNRSRRHRVGSLSKLRLSTARGGRRRGSAPEVAALCARRAVPERDGRFSISSRASTTITAGEASEGRYHTISGAAFVWW